MSACMIEGFNGTATWQSQQSQKAPDLPLQLEDGNNLERHKRKRNRVAWQEGCIDEFFCKVRHISLQLSIFLSVRVWRLDWHTSSVLVSVCLVWIWNNLSHQENSDQVQSRPCLTASRGNINGVVLSCQLQSIRKLSCCTLM